MKKNRNLKVSIVMGSQSDYKTMRLAEKTLKKIGVSFETKIVSAHRTPKRMFEFAESAAKNGFAVIIAGAGGAAHLPGMAAAFTSLPVLGVPVKSKALNGVDSLLSICQMPKCVAVGTLAIGEPGAANAGLLAAQILGCQNPEIFAKIEAFRKEQTDTILANPNPAE